MEGPWEGEGESYCAGVEEAVPLEAEALHVVPLAAEALHDVPLAAEALRDVPSEGEGGYLQEVVADPLNRTQMALPDHNLPVAVACSY